MEKTITVDDTTLRDLVDAEVMHQASDADRLIEALACWTPEQLCESAYGKSAKDPVEREYFADKIAFIRTLGGARWYQAQLDLGSRQRLKVAVLG